MLVKAVNPLDQLPLGFPEVASSVTVLETGSNLQVGPIGIINAEELFRFHRQVSSLGVVSSGRRCWKGLGLTRHLIDDPSRSLAVLKQGVVDRTHPVNVGTPALNLAQRVDRK